MKVYEKYSKSASSGIIVSSIGNVLLNGSIAKAPGLESVNLYDLKKGTRISTLQQDKLGMLSSVSALMEVGDFGTAVGYADGRIVIFKNDDSLVLQGHSSQITRFFFDQAHSRLISGSKDTKIILWDLVSESGIIKLQGHRDAITGLKLLGDVLISSANDSFIKIWDLKTFSCIENVSTSRGAIGAIEIINDKYLVLGLEDSSLKVYNINSKILQLKKSHTSGSVPEELLDSDGNLVKSLLEIGNLERSSKEKVLNLKLLNNYLGVQSTDSILEFYKIRSDQELEKKLARRKKRNKDSEQEVTLGITDYIPKVAQLKVSAKTKSFDFELKEKQEGNFRVLVQLTNNTLEWHEIIIGKKESETRLLSEISWQGHRSDIRALALSSDDQMYVSGSSNLVKIWNTDMQECIHTFDSGYILCIEFLPGNRYVVAGTKAGDLELFDLSSGSLIETVKAHDGAVWSLQIKPDKTGLVTGSQDKKVKFWDFRLLEENGAKRITLLHTQTMQMTDDVLCVRLSQDGKLMAVSLLDCTVKIFYTDSLKFFLSLYGHKLPVVSMDISSDGLLIATASSDKSVKIWGLDFGDCHASLRAHDDSVMAVQFVFGTHFLASVSKDKTLKLWDVDSREMIQKLYGHFGEVWSICIGKYGNFILTGSHDRSIIKWEKTSDQFILEESREEQLEEIYDRMDLDSHDIQESSKETSTPNLKTSETLKAGEKIQLVLELCQEEASLSNDPNFTRNPLLLTFGTLDMTASEIVLSVFQKIKPFQLEESLILLPFSQISNLLIHLKEWLKNSMNLLIVSKILNFILKTHFHQLCSTRSCRPVLLEISKFLRANLMNSKDAIGYNMAALEFMSNELTTLSSF